MAARQGCSAAKESLEYMESHGYGRNGSRAEPQGAAKMLSDKAMEGDADSQYWLGSIYFEGDSSNAQDYREAAKWYFRAARGGSASAMCRIGRMYQEGLGLGQDDEAAAGWFLEAAEKGSAEAQRRIGLLYRDGLGVERSIPEAGKWLGRAAEQGDADAKKELGLLRE